MSDIYPAETPETADHTPAPTAEAPFPTDLPPPVDVPQRKLAAQSRRDFLIYGAGVLLAAAGVAYILPEETRTRVGLKPIVNQTRKERILNKALAFDDDVAEALYSPHRLVPTYDLSQAARELRNNYDGQTPDPAYIPDWTMTVTGLASGKIEHLTAKTIAALIDQNGGRQDQVTRLVCVEGWSQIAGWGGLRFADFLKAYPPAPEMKWARLDSSLNLDSNGDPDPYYVSIDLGTAHHPQTLLATHQSNEQQQMVPLTVEHGAPLRLLVPMKLGLKNIKAITKISYTATQPKDYWSSEDADGQNRGYSHYDGL